MDKGDCIPALVSDSDEDAECDHVNAEDCFWEDIEDDDEEEVMNMLTGDVTCLFCSDVELSVEAVLSHCKTVHNFDLLGLCQRWSMDCIDYIKMINFCRQEHPCPNQITQGMLSGGCEWQDDQFMKAFDPNDLMLQLDIESALECLPTSKDKMLACSASSNHQHNDFDNAAQSEAVAALVARVKVAEQQRDLLQGELERAIKDVEKLKLSGQQLVMDDLPEDKKSGNRKGSKSKAMASLCDEDAYFASYSHHGIHMTMLKDEVRTCSYRDFMLSNRHLFEGKRVLDVGCGTGILSMFAVKAGAKQVVAVDSSQVIYQAMDIARENNMHESIHFVHGRLEDVTLPVDKFDVIISEWMGYFLLFEAMLDSVLWARDHYLAPGGWVYPDRFHMLVVGISHQDLLHQTVGYWDDVYGFKMSCMKGPVLDEVQVCTVPGDTVITQPVVIKEIDVGTCKVSDLDFESKFELHCLKDTQLTAVVGYFDTFFDKNCQHKMEFSTSPASPRTHWDQAVMQLPQPIPVRSGDSIPCHMVYRKHPKDLRGVTISLTVAEHRLKYSLS